MPPARAATPAHGTDLREMLRRVRRIDIRTRRRVTETLAGGYHSVFKGRGMEFHEVREYVPGDDVRSIDWNVTARSGHPHIKKFIEERELTVMLLVDISASTEFGSSTQVKKELLAELAGVLALSALRNKDKAGLLLFSDRVESYIAPAKGATQVLRMIREVLYRVPEGRETRLGPALEFLNRVTRHGTVVFLLSDFLLHDDARRALTVSARKHDLVALRVHDARETLWPAAGLVEYVDAESGRRYLLDSSDPRTRDRLQSIAHARKTDWRTMFQTRGIDLVDLETGSAYQKALLRFFDRRHQRAHR